MKRFIFIISLLISSFASSFAQLLDNQPEYNDPDKPTTIGIIISTNDEETIWNVMRFANYSIEWGNKVSIFLLGKGVEIEGLAKTNKDIGDQVQKYLDLEGTIYGCQVCFQSRKATNQICKLGCIQDMYEVVKKNKVVLSF
ncbi:MAG: hypothetical protein MJZ28_03340 [Paludibacteraceae bacterium]|nr:hypothetical protein [Paludibacteraceae bacterium]